MLKVSELKVSYQDQPALSGIDFILEKKDILAVVGESGSGKSTLAKALLGILPPTARIEGRFQFEDKEYFFARRTDFSHLRALSLALVMQDAAAVFDPLVTIGSHFHELLYFRGKIRDAAVRRRMILTSLEKVKMEASERVLRSYAHQFSGGQLQRIAIAMAIVLKPSILIADEPTSALDVVVESSILELFKELARTMDIGIIFITHNLGLARNFADKAIVLYRGAVVESGPCAQLFDLPQHDYTRRLVDSYRSLEGA